MRKRDNFYYTIEIKKMELSSTLLKTYSKSPKIKEAAARPIKI
jgi:hypothetical protein